MPEETRQADPDILANGHPPDPARGLRFHRAFPDAGCPLPFGVLLEERVAEIRDATGKVVFRQEGVLFPANWSQQATNIVAEKYFYGAVGSPEREYSVMHLISRVVGQVTEWGRGDGCFAAPEDAQAFHDDLTVLLLNQCGSFNSPVWFNLGLSRSYGIEGPANGWRWSESEGEAVRIDDAYQYPQISACFIQSVSDDMEGIMDLAASEAMLFKYGSGTGTDLSPLRSTREKLSGGGRPSGPVSFLRVYDAIASIVRSGGKTRRAAKMNTLRVGHPDILAFIECKMKEDAKARALIAAGYPATMTGSPDEAYSSVAFQNVNLSVRASDDFMEMALCERGDMTGPYPLRAVTDGRVVDEVHADFVLDKIAEGTWACGDPGMQFEDTIDSWHTCPNSGPINSSNPCSEYIFIDDSACNLASLNLMKFRRPDGSFDTTRFRAAVRIFITAQEILVDHASYPTAKIAENSHRFRPLGLGYTGLGALLMASGLPYDSDAGRDLAGSITALMGAQAYLTGAEVAAVKGPFEGFEANRGPMMAVIERHRDAALDALHSRFRARPNFWAEAYETWTEAARAGYRHGYRNAQATLLAPCGTIAFMMDSGHSTGIEPALALVVRKRMAGGGEIILPNPVVPLALDALGYVGDGKTRILSWVEEHGSVVGCPALHPDHLPVFDTAFGARPIAPSGHLRMMAAVQPFLSGAISKTVNVPESATVAEIRDAYIEAWRLGLKAVAIYRDGSKGQQPVSAAGPKAEAGTAPAPDPSPAPADHPAPRRERLPDTRPSITHKLSVSGYEAYVTAGMFPDGRCGEVFVTMAKEGSTVGGLMDQWATSVSLGLQYGVPLEVFVAKFSHSRYEPAGITANPDIRIATSLTDYVARWLGLTFLGDPVVAPAPALSSTPEPDGPEPLGLGVVCDRCGGLCVPTGSCHCCTVCGSSMGCS
jgi:ribonucleoside-diphosphate reductase alpha chain